MSDTDWPAGKTFGELTPAQQRAAVTRAARQLQSELQANAGAIGAAIDVAEAAEAPRLADTLALRISEMYAQMIDMGAEPHSDYMLTVAAFALQLAQDLALSGAERETFLARAYDDTPHPLGTEYGNPDEPPGAPWVVYPGQPGHSGHSVRPDKARTAWDDMPKTGGFSAGRD
jgi:hypothetical protein